MDKELLQKNRLRVRNFRKKQKIKNNNETCEEGPTLNPISEGNNTCNEQENYKQSPLETDNDHLQPSVQILTSDSNRIQSSAVLVEHWEIQSEQECQLSNRFSSDESDFSDHVDENESDSDPEENVDIITAVESSLAKDLRKWSNECLIPYSHLDGLLKILKPYHPELPLSSKSLLMRNGHSKYTVKKFNPSDNSDKSEFAYFGIAEQLQRIVDPALHEDNTLQLQFHVDGLPLFSSRY